MSGVSIQSLTKYFPNRSGAEQETVIKDLNLIAPKGKVLGIVGPNGCGKTTIFRVLSGLDKNYAGRVQIDGRPPGYATIGYMSQDFSSALLPWLSAEENILLPFRLEIRKNHLEAGVANLSRLASQLGDWLPLSKYPYQLSSGQQQAVLLLRTLVLSPSYQLLDEPFSALDTRNKLIMYSLLESSWRESTSTALFISHDIDETIFLADHLLILGKSPTRAIGYYDVPFARPRNIEIMTEPEFQSIRTNILSLSHKFSL